jgi:hypothetical protein
MLTPESGASTEEKVVKALQILIYYTPAKYQRCLQKLLTHLSELADREQYNKMGSDNLVIMFTPVMFPGVSSGGGLVSFYRCEW